MIRVLIVDDHTLVRLGIQHLLQEVAGIKVLGGVGTGEEAVKFARESEIDVVLLDIKMPGVGGLEALRRLLRTSSNIKVIALTMITTEPYPSRVLQSGAAGYLSKECDANELVLAIKKVFAGERYLSPAIAQEIALKSVAIDSSPGEMLFETLSDRELQVMAMITSGLKVQEIARKLCLSSKTVNSYRYRLFEKLKIKNDVELTHLAMQHNLLDKHLLIDEE